MPPSLFCEHKRLVSVCPLCGSARAGAATPQRGPISHDVDHTWHAFRADCHARLRDYLNLVKAGTAPADAYAQVYDALERRGKVHSEEEDTSTFRGGFYLTMVKLFDITVDDRRIQGYNGLADWEEMRDYVFRKFSPTDYAKAVADKRIKFHGGNGAWARQQITTELVRSDLIEQAVLHVAFGSDGKTPDAIDDAEVVARLERMEAYAKEAGVKPGTMQLASKILQVFAPDKWPALTTRTTPQAGEELGHPIPPVEKPADYIAFAEAMRDIATSENHADLDMTDIIVSDAWEMSQP